MRIQFDRNQDARTHYYNVYRSSQPGVTRHHLRVMQIKHPVSAAFIETSTSAARVNANTYQLPHRNVTDVTASVNGLPAPSYRVNSAQGRIVFDDPLLETDLVGATFTFDGVAARDSEDEQSNVLAYAGPAPESGTWHYRIEAVGHNGETSPLSHEIIGVLADAEVTIDE